VVSGKDWRQLGDTYDVYAGDVIDGNFKVPDKIIGTMEEGRVVGASSSYGQPFISPLAIKVRALLIRVS